jgi:hypothetical protein
VAGAQAVYGEWPLLSGGGGGCKSVTPIARIRSQYHDGSSPLAGLENAVRILREYLPPGRSSARRAA